jgi:hypothetical protein
LSAPSGELFFPGSVLRESWNTKKRAEDRKEESPLDKASKSHGEL